ncbi:hypothetical protein AAF712_005513 [Marasmius tenuissimus]|uniref:Uncharacterized protein n=1 Tax=Marasmius tenuissimus TaxID=585030 RepID=A0ABR3A2E2_9AGAR
MRSFSILLLLATTLVSPAVAAPVAVEETESLESLSPAFVHAMGPIITREDGDDAAAAAADHEKRENFKSGSWVHAMGSTERNADGWPTGTFVHAMGPIATREDGDDAAVGDHEKREGFKAGSWVHAMGPTLTYREDEKRDSDGLFIFSVIVLRFLFELSQSPQLSTLFTNKYPMCDTHGYINLELAGGAGGLP